MRLRRLIFLATLVTAGVAACGGGGNAVPSTQTASGPQNSNRTAVALRMVIPNTTQTTSVRTKKPEYVSAAVASIVYQVTAPNSTAPLVSGANYANVASSPSPCASGSGGLVCTIWIPATLAGSGTYDVTIATYDAAQTAACTPGGSACRGNLLGLASLPESITVGSTTALAVTLGGIPAYIQPISLTGYANGSGNNQNNGLIIFGPQPQTGVIELLDADGNTIIPPGAPVVTATSGNSSALTVTVATPVPGQYQVTFTAVKSGSYVQAGTYPVTLAMQIPNTSETPTWQLTVEVAHSALFVGTCTSAAAAVYGYLDGNTDAASPDETISTALNGCDLGIAPGIATDRQGDLYVVDGLELSRYATAPGSNPTPLATAGSAQGLSVPLSVAVDPYDTAVYAGDQTEGIVVFPTPGASGFTAASVTIPTSSLGNNPPLALDADGDGNLYAAAISGGSLSIFNFPAEELTPTSTPLVFTTLTRSVWSGGASLAIGVQTLPSSPPAVWFGGSTGGLTGSLWEFSAPGGTQVDQLSSGFGAAVQGIAVDGNGTVYVAYTSPGGPDAVVPLAAPSYVLGTPLTPPASGIHSLSVAVVPAANTLNDDHNGTGGSPEPIGTQSPLPSLRRP